MNMPAHQEIFDIVNEHDEVVGQRPRRDVHRLGLKHRAVHILIFNKRGELFLQKRSQTKDTYPGTWDSSAAGHLDTGESYDACALREVREELGIKLPAIPRRLFKIDACHDTGQEFVWVYQTEHEGPFVLQPEEIETGEWFTCDRLTALLQERPKDFARSFSFIWQRYLRTKS